MMEGGERRATAVYAKLILASASATAAETATFPLDMLKTRLQLSQGHGHGGDRGILRVASELLKGGGGVVGFYSGLSPAILRHLFYTPIRIVSYEHLRPSTAASDASLVARAIAGGASGVIAQGVASPADLIKVRMQAGVHQPRYTGTFDAFSKIVRSEGLLGLWRGVLPNAQRAFLVNMGELSCYDQAKHFIIGKQICGDNMYAHTMASITSGLVSTALSCPADVIKTRMMSQAAGRVTGTMYRDSYDCLLKTVKFEGIMALWKGFVPTWARLGPWQFVFWVSYEQLRHASGLSSF